MTDREWRCVEAGLGVGFKLLHDGLTAYISEDFANQVKRLVAEAARETVATVSGRGKLDPHSDELLEAELLTDIRGRFPGWREWPAGTNGTRTR